VNRKKAASSASPKLYRSIREVSAELDVKPHVLRYWETQFPSLRPKKNRAGNRMYRPEEVKLLTRIKELLYAQRFTIEGARRTLTDEKKPRSSKAAAAAVVVSAPPAHDAERERLQAALAAAQDELAEARSALATKDESLAQSKESLAEADDRDKTRLATLAVLRQELLLLARELRGDDEKPEPRVTVKAATEVPAAPEPELDEEPLELPVGAMAVSAGA